MLDLNLVMKRVTASALLFVLLVQSQLCLLQSVSTDSFVVDISALSQTGAADSTGLAAAAAAGIDRALRQYGLVILTGHGIDEELTASSFTAAYELFKLDIAAKQDAAIRNDNSSFGRGYLGFGDESGIAANFEPKEGYSYGSAGAGETRSLLNTPNKWPQRLSAASVDTLHRLYQEEVGVAKLIAQALSSQFSCAEGGESLAQIAEGGEHISLMRMFHYFHQGSEEVQRHLQAQAHAQGQGQGAAGVADRAMLGSSPHTDWGFLTVILADEVGGLQFIPRGGDVSNSADWVDVPYIPGSLIINGGDYLSLVSRGVYHSPIHRVLTPGSRPPQPSTQVPVQVQAQQAVDGASVLPAAMKDRYSFVLFFYPAYGSLVSRDVLGHCTHVSDVSTGSDREGSTGTDAAVSRTPAASVVQADGTATGVTYNTLLALDGERPREFGDYVIRKWMGVYRAN